MAEWFDINRGLCALLTAACGLNVVLGRATRRTRAVWWLLLAGGILHAVLLTANPRNLININLVHHYLGAKYSFPYADCYRLIQAARDLPQIGIRDLEDPGSMIRGEPAEQRAYFIDLLRGEGEPFDPLAPLAALQDRAQSRGALEREASRILRADLSADQVEDFRRDVRTATAQLGWNREITTDYGFNGSPLYSLVRQIDPTLHRAFGRETAIVNLVFQIAAALALAWIAGVALGLRRDESLAGAALLFASWDYVGYALPGLVFAGVWLPVALAALALRHRRGTLAGALVAWAGLIKLFPFLILLPLGARLARAASSRMLGRSGEGDHGWVLRALLSCALTAAVLVAVSSATGRSWPEFLVKIGAEFQARDYLANGVGLSQWIVLLGDKGADSFLAPILAVVFLAVLGIGFAQGDPEQFPSSLPRRTLLILSATGLAARTWLNYYTIPLLLLLPWFARRHRTGVAIALGGAALSQLLPDFDHPRLAEEPLLAAAKVAPYVLVPAWIVALELAGVLHGARVRRVAALALVVVTGLIGAEVIRLRVVRDRSRTVQAALDRSDHATALAACDMLVTLTPGNARARMDRGIALAGLDRWTEAGEAFAEAAALAPQDPIVRRNHGHWLVAEGLPAAALVEYEAARTLTPQDPVLLGEIARLHLARGRRDEAIELLVRARELDPASPHVRELLDRIAR